MKNRIWIFIFSAACLLCLAGWIGLNLLPADFSTAQIKQGNEIIYSIDLSAVEAPYEFDITCEAGENRVRVEKGRIAIISASCPDKVCVKRGYISGSAVPVVCLPHRLSITLTQGFAADSVDAVSGGL